MQSIVSGVGVLLGQRAIMWLESAVMSLLLDHRWIEKRVEILGNLLKLSYLKVIWGGSLVFLNFFLVDCESKLDSVPLLRNALGAEASATRLEASSIGRSPHFHRSVVAFHKPVLSLGNCQPSAGKINREASLWTLAGGEAISRLCEFYWSTLRCGECDITRRNFKRFRKEAQFAKNKAR